MQNLNANNKKLAEFACSVCHNKMRRESPQAIDCAWLGIDNEYCPDVMEALEGNAPIEIERIKLMGLDDLRGNCRGCVNEAHKEMCIGCIRHSLKFNGDLYRQKPEEGTDAALAGKGGEG